MIWTLAEPNRLRADTRAAVADGENEVFVSVVAAWEAAIKQKTGKLQMPGDLERQLERNRFLLLGVTLDHALTAGDLPLHHRDPFDRMMIAQARLESLTIVTSDRNFTAYGVAVLPA